MVRLLLVCGHLGSLSETRKEKEREIREEKEDEEESREVEYSR